MNSDVDLSKLEPRQREYLHYIMQGYTYKEIAQRTGRAHQTIKNQMFRATTNTGARTVNQLVAHVAGYPGPTGEEYTYEYT